MGLTIKARNRTPSASDMGERGRATVQINAPSLSSKWQLAPGPNINDIHTYVELGPKEDKVREAA